MRQKAGAGGVIGVKKLAAAAGRILLAGQIILLVLGREKGRDVVVKPPGNAGRGGILEVDDGVFVAGKFILVKQCAGAVDEAVILVARRRRNALSMEARKERG